MIETDVAAAPPAALAALHHKCFEDGWSADAFVSILATPGVFGTAVADDDGDQLAGFILCRGAADEAELLSLAVAPSFRRRGLGREMLARAMATARERGAARLHLEVAADNAAATALYESAGFSESGRRKAYYRRTRGMAVDAVCYAAAIK